jgi:hypothetical protein
MALPEASEIINKMVSQEEIALFIEESTRREIAPLLSILRQARGYIDPDLRWSRYCTWTLSRLAQARGKDLDIPDKLALIKEPSPHHVLGFLKKRRAVQIRSTTNAIEV